VPSALPTSLADLTDVQRSHPRHVDLVLPEVGGGRFGTGDVDRIASMPDGATLRVSGLDQPAFERLISRFGPQFSGLHFWKCPRLSDLSPLETCPNLTHVAFYWNQRATRLWDFTRTPGLRGLRFQDFSRLRSLEDLSKAVTLDELEFGDAIWDKNVVASLGPLEGLRGLRRLAIGVKGVEDNRVQPLAALVRLESFESSARLFTTEQFAWLRAHLPQSTRGWVLEPIRRIKPLDHPDWDKDVIVIGKRKPFLNSAKDAARIQRYVDAFWRLVETYRKDPSVEPG
jgi:hypothetical protein